MSDDNGLDFSGVTVLNGEVLTWDGTQWVVVPAPPLTNVTPATISGGTVTQGGTITVNTVGPIVSGAIGATGLPYITWVPTGSFQPQLELNLPEPEKKKVSEGNSCEKCEEYFPYAEPNIDNNKFMCYKCRNNC
ncbi:MAG TPA: hypothetical protein VII94_00310 [Candidatus Saccharimonadales bacterium]